MFKPALTILAFICLISCTNTVQQLTGNNNFTLKIDSVKLPLANVDQQFIYNGSIIFISKEDESVAYNMNTLKQFDFLKGNRLGNMYYGVYYDTLYSSNIHKGAYKLVKNKWVKCKLTQSIVSYPTYVDSVYNVGGCCAGEWGGSVFFYNKLTGNTYSCPATCANTVLKSPGGSYIVTSSLAHMSGSSSIIEIKDPNKLTQKHSDSLHCNWWLKKIDNEDYNKYQRGYDSIMFGTKSLFAGHSIMPLNTFYYKDSLYTIATVYPKQRVSSIKPKVCLLHIANDSTTRVRATIMDGRLKYYNDNIVANNNPTLFYGYDKEYGFIEVKGNHIRIVIFKIKTPA